MTTNHRDMRDAVNASRRMEWAAKFGRMAVERGDARAAAVYSKIHDAARAEVCRITGFDI